ncbi:4-hydroxybenzoate 3-monooxygenase [Prauserella cavernicola]|uniref:4-hydroxybenzoate 3-monooxygenase n=1 Tax=Prauserella cavernicola TaxID=2800127 RepID=A0A934QP82_9PSEU|nr:4-hydroxybenzoate 3-monooxygenase [Prauserella cavernicola]MBK1783556.1 4-hydroxybenzoate 3-monooxygenase [Prauserella cavernicola]
MTASTRVAVFGAGPAGLAVANILHDSGIDCVLLEARGRAFIEQRPRAGFIEEWAVRGLAAHRLADELLRTAPTHTGFEFRFEDARHPFDYERWAGQRHYVYPQQLLVTDLVRRYLERGGRAVFEVGDALPHDIESDAPFVTYTDPESDRPVRLDCDLIAGCDGAQGVTRRHVGGRTLSHDYGIGWLALLAEAPPSADGVVFGIHPRGFAAHMARTPQVTRFYLQCPPGDAETNWPDDRVWTELHARLGVPDGPIADGPIIEKRVLDMHNYVTEPMSRGRLHLAGESAHLVAPIAAKGLNLALHDAFHLTAAIRAHYDGDDEPLARYSETCLARVWQYQEFSQWLSDIFHSSTLDPPPDPFRARLAQARLRRLLGSQAAAASFSEIYIGKAADF